MVNRKRKRRIALVALLAFVLGTTAFAYAASITFSGGAGHAGQGTGAISGYDVTAVHYTLDTNNPGQIVGVQFTLNPDSATTVKARIDSGAWATCSAAPSPRTCGVTGSTSGATNLEVAAAD
jgi:hypothetical protein